jgi:phosphoglycerate dehydrogenase-like enzyme
MIADRMNDPAGLAATAAAAQATGKPDAARLLANLAEAICGGRQPGDQFRSHIRMKMPQTIGLVHFIGIGGIGMSGIAEVLNNLGYKVQGSDHFRKRQCPAAARQGHRGAYRPFGGQSR